MERSKMSQKEKPGNGMKAWRMLTLKADSPELLFLFPWLSVSPENNKENSIKYEHQKRFSTKGMKLMFFLF